VGVARLGGFAGKLYFGTHAYPEHNSMGEGA
jgi:hypothetical protein